MSSTIPADRRPTVLRARGLAKTYRVWRSPWRREHVVALHPLDLDLRAGECLGLLGPNGAGKTTTILVLLGLLPKSAGTIEIFDADPTASTVRARLGYLPEESSFYDFLTGAETLAFFAGLFPELSRATRRARAAELLDRVGLASAARRRVGEYSKGMRRRLGLACALVNAPDLLVLDEPTSGLDPLGSREVKDLVLGLKGSSTAVLLSSHILADVEDVVDRVAILHQGRLVETGTLDQLLGIRDHTALEFVSMGEAAAQRAIHAAKDAGAKLVARTTPRRDLEAHFLEVVRKAGTEAARNA